MTTVNLNTAPVGDGFSAPTPGLDPMTQPLTYGDEDLAGMQRAFQWANETGAKLEPGPGWSQAQVLAFNDVARNYNYPINQETGQHYFEPGLKQPNFSTSMPPVSLVGRGGVEQYMADLLQIHGSTVSASYADY